MRFTFFKIRKEDAIPPFEIEDFETAEQAKLHATSILIKCGYEAIEICQGDDCSLVWRGQKDRGAHSI